MDAPDQPDLDAGAQHEQHDCGQRQRQPVAEAVGVGDVGDVRPDHHELAVREVDDPHQPEHDAETQRDDRKRREQAQTVEQFERQRIQGTGLRG